MDKVEISDEQIVSIDAIAEGLSGLKITFVNVFGLRHQDGSWDFGRYSSSLCRGPDQELG